MPDPSPNAPIQIVGIGASAGGLEALGRFFEGVPPESGLAYVVILHLDPDRESALAEILDRRAPIPVEEVTESVAIEADRAYVISPHSQLALSGNSLAVEEMPPERPRTPVDHFFFSLAEEQEAAAIGVVLSGTGRDGSLGLRAIRENGGITAAQDPEEAEYPEMPRNAITEGRAELVLPAADLASEILGIAGRDGLERAEADQLSAETRSALERILATVGSEVGHDLRRYKRSTLLRRLDRRMRFRQIDTPEEYAGLLEEDHEERQALFQDLLISVSHFFRDPEAFEVLEQRVLPELFEGKDRKDQVRVWVPGCATGEEAYSVAILLHERAATLEDPPDIQVFATDIDEQALSFARRAHYPESVAADIPEERLARFFDRDQSGYRVAKNVRDTVLFAVHGVLSDPPFSHLDLVSCRNLLIYLEPSAQEEAVERFHYGLRPGGYLFLGSAESVAPELFQPMAQKERIYRRVDGEGTIPVSRPRAGRSRPAASDRKVPKHTETPDLSWEELHGRVLREHAPPNLLIDTDRQVLHLSEHAGRYLRHPGGDLTSSLLDLVREAFVPALRTALYRAFRNSVASTTTVEAEIEGETRTVDVTVRPSRLGGTQCALVVFEEADATEEPDAVAAPESKDLRELQAELEKTRDQLETTIAEREATIQDLQSANEELQSVNEEHQATAEELETRREELQSVNEELTTVNEEHRATIEELSRVNADLENLMDSTEIATVFLDEDLHVRRFTESATDLFNLLPSDEGRPFQYVTHNLELEGSLEDDLRKVLDTSDTVEREVWDEEGRCYVMAIHPYRSQENRVTGAVITCFDITDRKRMEENIREARSMAEAERRRLLALVNHLPAGVVLLDVESRKIRLANQRARNILWGIDGGRGSPDVGSGVGALDRLPNFGRWPIEQAVETGEAVLEKILSIEVADGSRRDLLVSVAPIEDAQHQIRECALVLVDIEEILRHTREQAAHRARERFLETLSMVTHEFRTPLNSIVGYVGLLTDGVPEPIPEAQLRNVERIRTCAQHLNFMVGQMLTYTRMKEEREVEPQSVDPESVALEASSILEPEARQKDLSLRVETEEVGEIVTDPPKLRQVLVNLVQNAVKFTEEGEVVVAVLEGDDEGVVFEVRDTGVGIEEDELERIFERFWKASGQPIGVQSTGLGLAIVKELTHRLGGHIEVESEPGRGSVFRVWLPQVLTQQGANEIEPAPFEKRELVEDGD